MKTFSSFQMTLLLSVSRSLRRQTICIFWCIWSAIDQKCLQFRIAFQVRQ